MPGGSQNIMSVCNDMPNQCGLLLPLPKLKFKIYHA